MCRELLKSIPLKNVRAGYLYYFKGYGRLFLVRTNEYPPHFNLTSLQFVTPLHRLFLCMSLLLCTILPAQNVFFNGVQDMNLWYNPALKTNKLSLVHANVRSVKYRGITSYTSKAISIELPPGSAESYEDNTGFTNLAFGMNADNASNGILKVSSAMMAFSYALPLNYDNTYLSAGLQAAYTFSRVGSSGVNYFGGDFDQNGAIGSAISADPFQSGYQFNYFTAGAGASIFHSGTDKQWYVGTSARHLNQPYTEWTRSSRLSINVGLQAGYSKSITAEDLIGGYSVFNWQGSVHQETIGIDYTRNLSDSAGNAISIGLGYRFRDALIPNIGLKFGKNRVGFHYEYSFGNREFSAYRRTGVEFSYRLIL